MYNPINDRINNLMNQKQMIESQLQTIQQMANIPPININNQITPNMALNDFNGKWVNNEQEASAYGNVSGETLIQVPCGASYTITLGNNSGLDLSVQNANIIIKKLA